MTDTLETTTEDPAHDNHHGPTDKQFIGIFFFLAAVTGLEVLISYIDVGPAFLPLLLGLMAVKFFTVVWYFMHIKFDAKIFGRLFYIGLGLAVVVYTGALSTFQFFAG
jgi:cytochrome c oxidase subunit 4